MPQRQKTLRQRFEVRIAEPRQDAILTRASLDLGGRRMLRALRVTDQGGQTDPSRLRNLALNDDPPHATSPRWTAMRLSLFDGLRPFSRGGAVHNALAGVILASMNIPQVLGYARIAGMPVVTGLYTVLLPLVAFAVFGSSRHLVVAAELGHGGDPVQCAGRHGGARQRALRGAGRHGGAADRRAAAAGADLQAGVPRRFPVAHGAGRVPHRRRACRSASRC